MTDLSPKDHFRLRAIATALAIALAVAMLALSATAGAFTSGESTITTTIKGYGTVTVTSGGEPHPSCTSPASNPQSSSYTGCATVVGAQHDNAGTCSGSVCTWHVTLTATAPAGWHFAGWSGDCTGTGTCTNVDETSDCTETPCEIEFIPTEVTASFVDDRAPTTTFGTAPAANTVVYSDTQSEVFTWSTNEDNEAPTFACKRDLGSFSACSSGFTWSSIADGIHDFCVHGTDASGLQGADACRHWQQETNPTASISTKPPSVNTSPTAAFTFTSNKTNHPADGSTLAYECKLDGGAFGSCPAAGKSYSSLADGSHTFQVEAVFTAALGGGAHTSSAASYTWTQDTTPPALSIDSGPADGSVAVSPSSQASFGFTASDATSPPVTFLCRLDGGPFEACTGSTSESLSGVSDGEHEFAVQATDGAGLSSTRTIHWEQETPADVVIDSGPAEGALLTSRAAHFAFHSSKTDRPVEFQCALDSNTFSACSGAGVEDLANLGDGSHTLQIRAVFTASLDGSQHAGAPVSRTWTVKGEASGPPTASLGAGVSGKWKVRGGRTKVKSLNATSVPAGSTIVISCKGKRGSCKFKSRTIAVGAAAGKMALTRYFKGAELAPGTTIEVRITKPGTIGVDVTFRTRRRKPPTETQRQLESVRSLADGGPSLIRAL